MAGKSNAVNTATQKSQDTAALQEQLAETQAKLAAAEAKLADADKALAAEKERAEAAEDKAREIAVMQRGAEAQVRRAGMKRAKEKRVTVMVPRSDQNPHDTDVPVIINGNITIVKRGAPIEVPESVAEVLRHSQEQANAAGAVQAQFMYLDS